VSRLRELRLHGFKSFADPVTFVFEPGVNAVIGPNGSGKSNMADAVRWVLGEQSNRSLRTRRADEVIFAGSEGRRAQGLAEAILTLDNADGWLPIDFAEVTIGRRAYRSGEGEYLINGARARLRDVVELLGSGRLGANELVVVGQGTVDAALSLRPEERRQLFEEAAGVKNLQVRKNEAASRLAKARDNLTRVSDLIGELKPQVRRLALQAEHQQQHQALTMRARALVLASHRRREQAARAALGDARRAAAEAEAALETFRGEQESGRSAVAEAERAYWASEERARGAALARERTRETLIRAESRHESLAARHEELTARLTSEQEELATARTELAEIERGETDVELAGALEAAAAEEARWRAAVAELAEADAAQLAAEEALAAERRAASERIAADARRSEQDARATAQREQASAELDAGRARLAEARQALDAARLGVAAAEHDEERQRAALEAAASEREAAQDAADRVRQTTTALEQRATAARAELAALEERARHHGRLGARLVEAGWPSLLDALDPPAESLTAIEVVVGGELEQALLWREADPSGSLAEVGGAARFVAPGTGDDAGRAAALDAVSGERTLAELVRGPAPAVLERAALAPSLEALLAGWRRLPPGWCAVTLEGDLADARGVLVLRGRADPPGGSGARDHLRRRELAELVARIDAERAEASEDGHEAVRRLRSARDRHLAARAAHDAAEGALRRARADADAAEAHASRAAEAVGRLEAELRSLPAQRPISAESPAERVPAPPPDRLVALDDAARRARERRDGAAAATDAARDEWNEKRAAAEALDSRTAGRRGTTALLEARIAQLESDLPARESARTALADQLATAARAVAEARAADGRASGEAGSADREREQRRAALLELERSVGSGSGQLAELERAAQATAIEASRREDALSALARERDLALEGLPAVEGEPPAPEGLDELDDDGLERESRSVRRTLAQIGSVNPFAVEEHRELAERLEGLTTQDADLRAAIAETDELIARLEGEISQLFDAAFRAIGARFDEYCRLLFAGGSASLQMADEADGDAPGGIEIVVRPPGKRLQRLSMLSGGERALTGVALLFAMLSVNPVPFCILDEVDAALDEANIGRFAQALRKLAESIDFVVITHNRATIEVADTIYGVTMTDAAVSRVLSLRLADLPAEVSA
jgi:chromosome segregation protein